MRVLRLAKVARVLRAVTICKKYKVTDADTYVIGDEEAKNDGDELRADHLKEQLTTMLTIKVHLCLHWSQGCNHTPTTASYLFVR